MLCDDPMQQTFKKTCRTLICSSIRRLSNPKQKYFVFEKLRLIQTLVHKFCALKFCSEDILLKKKVQGKVEKMFKMEFEKITHSKKRAFAAYGGEDEAL